MSVKCIRTLNKPRTLNDTYPKRGTYIYNQVSNFKIRKVWPLFRAPAPANSPFRIFDLGIVMCSYGHDSARIAAALGALSWITCSKPLPHIYFVEAAKEGEDYEFESYFLNKQCTTYLKQIIPPEADGLWLKEALWTIGAKHAIAANKKLTKLCFIDSDVEFVDQMWATEVSNALNDKDAISPHSHFYYEGTEEVKDFGLMPSTGRALTTCYTGTSSPGMAFACTIKFFEEKLNSRIETVSCGSGDTFLWYTIAGLKTINYDRLRLPYSYTFPKDKGVVPPPKIGDAAQIAVHRFHGSVINRLYRQRKVLLKLAIDTPFKEYTYLENGMPIWSDTPGGRILSRAMPEVYTRSTDIPITVTETMKLYSDEAIVEYGAINEEYPLVIACALPDDSNESINKVIVLKQQFAAKCKAAHRFVCLTNKSIPNVETIPIPNNELPGYLVNIQVLSSIGIDEKTSVLYCDLNTVVNADIYPHRCPANNVSMIRAKEIAAPIDWGVWSTHAIYYRGNFSNLINDALLDVDIDYQYTGEENLLTELLVKNNIYPTSIEQHFCTRFYMQNQYSSEAQLIVFYNKDPAKITKTWIPNYNIDPYSV